MASGMEHDQTNLIVSFICLILLRLASKLTKGVNDMGEVQTTARKAVLIGLCVLPITTVGGPSDSPRDRLSFNADWRFKKGDPVDVRDELDLLVHQRLGEADWGGVHQSISAGAVLRETRGTSLLRASRTSRMPPGGI